MTYVDDKCTNYDYQMYDLEYVRYLISAAKFMKHVMAFPNNKHRGLCFHISKQPCSKRAVLPTGLHVFEYRCLAHQC